MSYDLDLFQSQPQIDPILTIQQSALIREGATTPLNISVSRKLISDNPNMQTKIADDVIEVMDEVEGIRVTLYAHSAQISIPFWFTEDAIIDVAFRTARQYLLILVTHTGYTVYDSQLGRVIDLYADLPSMIQRYKQAINGMQQFN